MFWPWALQTLINFFGGNSAASGESGNDFDVGKAFNGIGQDIGNAINNITGTSASNAFAAGEAEKSREHATSERLAAQEFNSAEAQKSRDWSEMMESTRYQRTMEDMMAAGVNPMMAFMSGSAGTVAGAGSTSAASSSAGSSASAGSSGNSASAVSGLIRSLTSLLKTADRI